MCGERRILNPYNFNIICEFPMLCSFGRLEGVYFGVNLIWAALLIVRKKVFMSSLTHLFILIDILENFYE